MDKLLESKLRLEQTNGRAGEPEGRAPAPLTYRRSRGPRFEERYRRVTTYLENGLFREVESLRERGKILNVTAMFNEAVREHIQKHYGGDPR
ncbi:MAG: hypothetical protein ACOY4I_13375 [Bacillota bacterium]